MVANCGSTTIETQNGEGKELVDAGSRFGDFGARCAEEAGRAATQCRKANDHHQYNQCNDEAIFNRGCATLALEKTFHKESG